MISPLDIIRKYRVRAYCKEAFKLSPTEGHIESPHGGIIEYLVKIEYITESKRNVKFNRIEPKIKNLTVGNIIENIIVEGNNKRCVFEVPLLYKAPDNLQKVLQFKETFDFLFDTSTDLKRVPFKLSGRIGTELYR